MQALDLTRPVYEHSAHPPTSTCALASARQVAECVKAPRIPTHLHSPDARAARVLHRSRRSAFRVSRVATFCQVGYRRHYHHYQSPLKPTRNHHNRLGTRALEREYFSNISIVSRATCSSTPTRLPPLCANAESESRSTYIHTTHDIRGWCMAPGYPTKSQQQISRHASREHRGRPRTPSWPALLKYARSLSLHYTETALHYTMTPGHLSPRRPSNRLALCPPLSRRLGPPAPLVASGSGTYPSGIPGSSLE
ncbi:hypothetical protein D9619_008624 [Psilocybe cf. subviscida]|uniref:Uncharacterized protein n=1 Tax=Psilocybe cf. subviscida TaxID=2480587 RepID=A0A8H5F138_9AGAR|nr:hypothetical protein D9619_008624 [Psilocybe cf. subviscida]